MKNKSNQTFNGSLNGEPAAQSIPAAQGNAENVVAGIIGAFLFSLIGGVLYFIIYQIGFIAGISGLVIFVLANFGYGLFSGNKNSITGIIISIICLILTTLLAEYMCIAYAIYDSFREYDVSLFAAIRSTFDFIIDPEVDILADVIYDLLIALGLGALSAFAAIRTAIKASKAPAASVAIDSTAETQPAVDAGTNIASETPREENNGISEE